MDLKYVCRVLGRSRGFTAVAILSLGIGVGANAAVFSVVRSLLLDSLSVPAPDELALVYWSEPAKIDVDQVNSGLYRDPATGASYRSNYSHGIYLALRAAVDGTSTKVSGFNFLRDLRLRVDGGPAIIAGGALVDGRYFDTLRLGMAVGRPLAEADERPGAPPVAVLGYTFWQRAFGGSPAAVGRTIHVNGAPFEIVGVSARGFRSLSRGGSFSDTSVTVPLSAQPLVAPRWAEGGRSLFADNTMFWVRVIARVPRGTSRASLEQTLTATLRPLLPGTAVITGTPPVVRLLPGAMGEQSIRPETERLLFMLLGVVSIVLLITCVNLAALMLARGVSRQRELAVRLALGSGRMRVARQVLLESLLLACAGSAAGLVLTHWSSAFLSSLLAVGVGGSGLSALEVDVDVNMRVAATTAGAAVAATLLFGLLPALRVTAVDPRVHLAQRVIGRAAPRLAVGRALIAVQIAVSLPLVVGAVLFLRTLSNLGAVDLGFDPDNLVIFRLDPEPTAGAAADPRPRLHQEVLRQVREIPGVDSATLVENVLMSGTTSSNRVVVDGRDSPILLNAVGPGFFETMGMRVLAGRPLGEEDTAGSPVTAVVNEAAVRRLFGGVQPLGRRVRIAERELEIVGVVADSRYARQRAEIRPVLFDSVLQRPSSRPHVVIRTLGPLTGLEPLIRRLVESVDRNLTVPEIRTQLDYLAQSTARERVFAQVLTIFGGFALLLAGIGLHGVTSYAVARRTSEIGVRVALGARRSQVLWLIMRQVALLAVAGLATGVPLALAATPVMASMLFGVAPRDPVVIGVASTVLVGAALLAGLLPACRAARMDALVALRSE
jgi:predicted permease